MDREEEGDTILADVLGFEDLDGETRAGRPAQAMRLPLHCQVIVYFRLVLCRDLFHFLQERALFSAGGFSSKMTRLRC